MWKMKLAQATCEDLQMVRNQLTGTHRQVQVVARKHERLRRASEPEIARSSCYDRSTLQLRNRA